MKSVRDQLDQWINDDNKQAVMLRTDGAQVLIGFVTQKEHPLNINVDFSGMGFITLYKPFQITMVPTERGAIMPWLRLAMPSNELVLGHENTHGNDGLHVKRDRIEQVMLVDHDDDFFEHYLDSLISLVEDQPISPSIFSKGSSRLKELLDDIEPEPSANGSPIIN